jgi:hypothetical protein
VVTSGGRNGWIAPAIALWAMACGSSALPSNPDAADHDGAPDIVHADVTPDVPSEGGGDAPLDLEADVRDAPPDLGADGSDDAAEGGSDRPGDTDGSGGDTAGACGTGPLTACACGTTCTGPCARLCNAVPASGVCRDPANGTCECGGVMVDNCVKPAARCLCPSCGEAPGALCVTDAQRAVLCAGPNAAAFRCN